MDATSDVRTAKDIVNTCSEEELSCILQQGGEDKWGSRIAHRICTARKKQPIETTLELANIVKRAIPAAARRNGGHPAKRSFQALRIEVNHEFDALRKGLEAAIRWLNPKGRIVVISYHSLEDMIVKEEFRKAEHRCTCPPDLPVCACGKKPVLKALTRKAKMADAIEVKINPRAHSARMRAAEKL